MRVDPGALSVLSTLREAGFRALLAGGCVRDMLMGNEPVDWDIATDAGPDQVGKLFPRTLPVGAHFGVSVVLIERGQYEVARFRRDGPYLDGRHPARVEPADESADAQRRDFTINGLFYDPFQNEIIDYVGGRDDIERGLVRAIGDPHARFSEDYLRLLRCVRFVARFDFSIDDSTRMALSALASGIESIAAERVGEELTRMLTDSGAVRGLELMMESGLLSAILPEVARLRGVEQPPEFHPEGDVWTHSLLVMGQLDNPTPELAWAALLHDIGKEPTFEVRDRIRFNRHDIIGAKMAEAICRRLRMSNARTERIGELVAKHMCIRNMPNMRESTRRRFLRQDCFLQLLELHRADCMGCHGKLDLYEYCQTQLELLSEEQLRPPRLVNGRDLLKLGLEPGPLVGRVLRRLEEAQLEGDIDSRNQALAWVRSRYGASFKAVGD